MTVGQGCQLFILPARVAEGGDPGPVQLAPHLLLSLQEECEYLQSWLDILSIDLKMLKMLILLTKLLSKAESRRLKKKRRRKLRWRSGRRFKF